MELFILLRRLEIYIFEAKLINSYSNIYIQTENRHVFFKDSLTWKFSILPAGGNLNIYTAWYFQQTSFIQKGKRPKMSDNCYSAAVSCPLVAVI